MEDLQQTISKGIEALVTNTIEYAPKILLAIVVLVIGNAVIKRVNKLISKALDGRKLDEGLKRFLINIATVLLRAALIIAVLQMVGVETTSLLAILGAAGLAVGLALQGSLSNFAGGVMILLFKPFKIGDLITAQGHTGHVRDINLFVTTLETPESKTVIVPNAPLSNGDITNLTSLGKLRVDLVVGISYDADIKQAREVLMKVMEEDPKVMDNPAPSVNVLELADSSVNLAVRPYATPADYWDVYFGITEKAKIALDAAQIEIPYPQVVHHQANS
ncbi:MAG: mechanosensitive ion channel domain-containing protein [Bacteroidota bacterium]